MTTTTIALSLCRPFKNLANLRCTGYPQSVPVSLYDLGSLIKSNLLQICMVLFIYIYFYFFVCILCTFQWPFFHFHFNFFLNLFFFFLIHFLFNFYAICFLLFRSLSISSYPFHFVIKMYVVFSIKKGYLSWVSVCLFSLWVCSCNCFIS